MSEDHKKPSRSIFIFQLFSIVAVLTSCVVFVISINKLDQSKNVVLFCETLLGFMFVITAAYTFIYVVIVICYRMSRQGLSSLEALCYFFYGMFMVFCVMSAVLMRYDYVTSDYIQSTPSVKLTWPSAILAFLLLLFDFIVLLNPSFRRSSDADDRYWYYVFSEALKLDFAILLGFLLIVYLLFVFSDTQADGRSELLIVLVAGSEIMLFLASNCVFAIDAMAPLIRKWLPLAKI